MKSSDFMIVHLLIHINNEDKKELVNEVEEETSPTYFGVKNTQCVKNTRDWLSTVTVSNYFGVKNTPKSSITETGTPDFGAKNTQKLT
jgi:hypothetical protein